MSATATMPTTTVVDHEGIAHDIPMDIPKAVAELLKEVGVDAETSTILTDKGPVVPDDVVQPGSRLQVVPNIYNG